MHRWPTASGFSTGTNRVKHDAAEAAVHDMRGDGVPERVRAAAVVAKMAEAILKNTRQIISICVYCDGQYDICGEYSGVPAILGINGIEKSSN